MLIYASYSHILARPDNSSDSSVISGPGHNAPLCYCSFGSVKPQGLPYFIENTVRDVKENQSPNK